MDAWVQQLLHHSTQWAVLIIMLITFLESLALVGLILPGTVMMATLGALVGKGDINFYAAWGAGIVGCLIGDGLSFFAGWRFKEALHRWRPIQKYQSTLHKIEQALSQHNFATIIIGRFIGPTRPLVPLAAGMLELPAVKFLLPSITGCLLWPPVYLMPGILTGVALNVQGNSLHQTHLFIWLLVGVAAVFWLSIWLVWRWFKQRAQRPVGSSAQGYLVLLSCVVAFIGLVVLCKHPLMPLFSHLLWQVLSR